MTDRSPGPPPGALPSVDATEGPTPGARVEGRRSGTLSGL